MIIKDKSQKSKMPIVAIIILLMLFVFGGLIVKFTGFLSKVVFPVQEAIYQRGVYVKELGKTLLEYKRILDENKVLKAAKTRVEMLDSTNKNLIIENIRLKELLDMKQSVSMDFKVATVNFRKPENLYENFYINLGKDKNIEKDMVVFVDKNVVGKVREVFDDYSIVDMLTGKNYSISAMSENNMLGVIKGSDEGDGTLYFEPNTFREDIRVGEKIYTSGISEIYPKGLYIGEVVEVNGNEFFSSIKVKSEIDIINMTEVLIMVPEEN